MEFLVPPWQHQREAIERAKPLNEFALFLDPGTGKTATTINIYRQKCMAEKRLLNALIFCPPIVVPNWKDEFLRHSKIDRERIVLLRGHGKKRLKLFEEHRELPTIFVTNYESLLMKPLFQAFIEWRPEVLVLDECFIEGTLIDTPAGPRPIENIRAGDKILNCLGEDVVVETFEVDKEEAIKIFVVGGSFICSLEHLLFTQRGWVRAVELLEGDYLVSTDEALCLLQKGCCKTTSQDFLQSELQIEISVDSAGVSKKCCEKNDWQKKPLFGRQNAEEESDAQCSDTKESERNIAENWPQAENSRREWTRPYFSRKNFMQRIGAWLGDLFCSGYQGSVLGLPKSLQDRYSSPEEKNSGRVRRILAHGASPSSARCKKGRVLGVYRMDRFALQKLRDSGEYGEGRFFDLSVRGHPSYSVGGFLVHNCHKCKDIKASRTKLAIQLSKTARFRYILSGSPVLNSPLDLFSQFLILDGGQTFGQNFFAFRARYFRDRNAGMPKDRYFPNWQIIPGALDEINRLIFTKGMRVEKKDCLDLPPLVRQVLKVQMTPEQARLYKEMKRDFITFMEGKTVMATLAMVKALRLMQISSGYIKTTDDKEIAIEGSPKQAALEELLTDLTPNHKVIVWAVWRQNYEQIRQVCDRVGVKYVEVHGDVSDKQKEENVKAFDKDDSVRVLIGHPASGGIGVNLIRASYAIFYSRNFSLEQSLQAEARNYRGGSEIHEKITRIDLVVENSLEEIIAEKLAQKQEISDYVLRDISLQLKAEAADEE